MEKLIDINSYPINRLLPLLLKDKTTGDNIIWATDDYSSLGAGYGDKNCLSVENLTKNPEFVLQPRVCKSLEAQKNRTRTKAEVFTSVELVNYMLNMQEQEYFGRKDIFNYEKEDGSWEVNPNKIPFDSKKDMLKFINRRVIEITCGEAPFLISRYDTTTGQLIKPPMRRVGMLDRKLRVINENTDTKEEWMKLAEKAFKSSYAFEWSGDNLILARINAVMTYYEYYIDRWKEEPDFKTLKHIANIIVWNIWQMDGLKNTTPLGKPIEEYHQMDLFETEEEQQAMYCKIKDWKSNKTILFKDCRKED